MLSHKGIPDSEFYMWRAVFAFSFVDGVLSLEEQELLSSYLTKIPLSLHQRDTLKNDMRNPQRVEDMYKRITNPEDKKRFCTMARALVWCEGDMDKQEAQILKRTSCLSSEEENEYLYNSRDHPHLHDYYQHYARSGLAGLLKVNPTVQLSI